MVHHRQRLALGLETGDDRARVHARLDDLERDAAAHRLLLVGDIDHATAALADLLAQLVAPDPVPGLFGERRREADGGGRGGLVAEELGGVVVR